jgi:prepilin-type N-terminal cleavage/methylation domain-containing protein
MQKLLDKNKKGFTLIETLIAVFVLVLAITGPLVYATNNLRSSFDSRDQITAFYLAQDVLEYIKNKRDDNVVLDGLRENWLTGFSLCQSSNGCTIDTMLDIVRSCPNSDGCSISRPLKIYQQNNLDVYGIDPGSTKSRFWRKIEINDVVSSEEVSVTITVGWSSSLNATEKKIVVKEHIFNWAISRN